VKATEQVTRRPEFEDDGAHFFRADFQVHTPRDNQWEGARPQNEAERKKWAVDFVAACRSRDLNAVAITDHHDFAMYPYLREAALAETDDQGVAIPEKDRLVVFPGLELTLSVPCQAILILDASFPLDRLDDILKALHVDPTDAALDRLPSTSVLPDSGTIDELTAKLDKNEWLKGHYVLLPNVTPGGHKTLLRTSFQTKYKDMSCVGGYLDGPLSKLDAKNHVGSKKILDGLDKAWGNKRLALFQTSDARTADFSHLGEHTTWVKWSEPTAEALRQACLAQESRLSQASPSLSNVWISRVVVSQSTFMGRIDTNFNPQYSALIGGRGTGKSTILDYIRWALCDQPASAGEDDEVADPRVRQRRLVQATLAPVKAHVEVHCLINGIPHVVRRDAENGEVHLKVGDAEFEKSRESVIQGLLPIQAYSQKQLSSVAIRMDELLRFITSPIQRELDEISRQIGELTGRLRENYGTLQRHRTLETEITRSRVRITSITEQAQAIRDGLAGLSEEDRGVLNAKSQHDASAATSRQWRAQLEALDAATTGHIDALQTAAARLAVPADAPAELRSDLETALAAIQSAIADLQSGIQGSYDAYAAKRGDKAAITVSLAKIDKELSEYNDRYAAVKQRSTAHETKLQELAALEQQVATATELLQQQQQQISQLGDPKTKHVELRADLDRLNRQKTGALSKQCGQLSDSSDGLIRATLEVGQNFGEAQVKMKGLISGSNVRTARIDTLFEQLATDKDPVATWEKALAELEFLMLLEPDAEVRSEQTPELTRLGLPIADQKRIMPQLTPDGWLDLSLTPLTDKPKFEYRSKEATYIPFGAASAGQQATALLTTLLSQDGMPLIIDQPEEDLDSDTVQQIVTKIWEAKGRRQLIFASHNANLVVNGDADLVLVCAYVQAGDQSAGNIKLRGAIDQEKVRHEITKVMEGGETAFKLRKEKYGF
jgi:type III restriction enzyme